MKNGFTKTQNGFCKTIDSYLEQGISFSSAVGQSASEFHLTNEYVLDTYLSFIKQKMVIA